MRAVGKFLLLPASKKLLACEVLFCVVLLRVFLTCLPFRLIFGWSQRCERKTRGLSGPLPGPTLEKNLARLVRTVGRRIPKATCLTQALSLQVLLARRGQHSKLCIGVGKRSSGEFHAHAWLQTRHGVAIGGGAELDSFRPLLH